MIPFLPGGRRHAGDTDGHLRARTLLAARMDDELVDEDEAWLSDHLITCSDCIAVDAAYTEQRGLLRGLAEPIPPRDLWARTRAKVELESRGSGARSPRRSVVPLGALSGVLVVAVVVGASLLSQPTVTPVGTGSPSPLPSVAAASVEPRATPIAVRAGEVGWALQNDDGSYELAFADVSEVCGSDIAPDCAPLDPPATSTLRLTDAPRAIVKSPTQDQLVVVEAGTRSEGGSVIVVPVPSPATSPEPTAAPSPSIKPSVSPSPPPTPTPTPDGTPSTQPSAPATAAPSPGTSPEPTVDPSAEPSKPPGGDTAAEPLAILADVVLVGGSAAYSSDGSWFAFSTRPADATAGPDIYVWRPGESDARAVTVDHRSVFSAWVGDRILGSRVVEPPSNVSVDASPSPLASPLPEASASFLLDPATGEETVFAGIQIWRPVVDPTGRFVVFWDGDVEVDANGVDWRPGAGRIVLARLDPPLIPGPSGPPEPSASVDPEGGESSEPVASEPAPSALPVPTLLATLTEGVVRDWDIHWDEIGTRFAIWLADPLDLDVGAISLHQIDDQTGALDPLGAALIDVPALAGFSIGDGRLAWATPPGQGGEGSRVIVLAWQGEEAGRIETVPDRGSAALVVIK